MASATYMTFSAKTSPSFSLSNCLSAGGNRDMGKDETYVESSLWKTVGLKELSSDYMYTGKTVFICLKKPWNTHASHIIPT